MGHPRRKHTPQLKARTTRSSRGRLLSLSDPAQTSQRLDDQLRALGLYAAPTLGDGNCLFRALSDQLYGTDSKHALLRQHICDWIQHHKSRYEPFVEDERGIDTHLHCMRENATYGGHMELSAFAHMAQRNVKVVQPGLVYVIEWQAFAVSSSPTTPSLPDKEDLDGNDDNDPHSSIYVAYHDWEHFSSIRNLKGPHVGLPRVKERPVSQTDLPPSPITEHHKQRKRVGKDRDRERQERRREKAREKIKGKQIPTTVVESETDDDDEPEISSSPEKLKIKLKLTLNNNHTHSPSSSLSNISETDNNKSPQKTGLKLRLPPSRSLSLAPSTISTPPNSQTSISEIYPSIAEALPHANPPTHTAAPHLVSNSRESSPGTGEGGGRINRSPKRTFEESEIEDLRMMNGGRGVRSRLCVGDDEEEEDNVTTTTATTTTTTASSSTLSSSPESSSSSPSPPCLEKDDEHLLLSPDDTIMTSPTTPTASSTINNLDTSLQQQRTQRKQQQCRSIHSQSSSPSSIVPFSSSSPKSSSSTSTSTTSSESTISTTSTSSPYMTTRQQKKREVSNNTNQHQQQHRNNNGGGSGGGGRMLTRRQRKALGLPKLRKRRVGPYDRTESGGGGGGEGKGGEGEGGGEEWKKNGTGRVDVRGFRELKI
ncbi:hypothetical protein Agabi119p4_11600 [Agaricus bisporus var. burnettii]|uniref:OTU domain-containing protein n=1 Tax=Agaricus bisporus var. burnettii TaxID=192524 RepID=A0A8H7C0P6_AGABI|nr:hypothetical protein Agabi119p4_11600 [Agaricus bisporus var. burnettii]